MSKHNKDPLIEALREGRSYTWTVADGGYFASMRKAIKHGQTLTMSPIADPGEITVGDLVLVLWQQGTIFHIVGEIEGDRYLIVNSLGKINGWVDASKILGRITEVIEPEPRPDVQTMFEQLESAFQALITIDQASEDEARRLLAVIDDLRWYADRLGPERLDAMPRSNKWSFLQNLWHLTRLAKAAAAPVPDRIHYFIDRGKQCVGLAGEIYALFEYGDSDW